MTEIILGCLVQLQERSYLTIYNVNYASPVFTIVELINALKLQKLKIGHG